MDPLSLAAAAVGLLVPYFRQAAGKIAERAGERLADSTLAGLRSLYERVRAGLVPGSYRGGLLEGVQAEPDDPGLQEVLKLELAKLIAADPQFAEELERLVAHAEQAGAVRITASDSGMVAGRDVQQHGRYVAGRDMAIGSPPSEQS
jgi:hypothetical protein